MENITLSVINGEIIPSGTVVELKATRPISSQAAQGAVTVKRDGKKLTVTTQLKNDTIIQVPTQGFAPGPYRLDVFKLADKEGQIVTEAGSVTFIVGAIKGAVSSELSIHQANYLAIGDLTLERLAAGAAAPLNTTYLEIIKAVNRSTNEQQSLSFDKDGKAVDGDKQLIALQQRRYEKYGRLTPALYDRLQGKSDNDKLNVHVWPVIDFDIFNYDKPTNGEITVPLSQETVALKKLGDAHFKAIERAGGEYKPLSRLPVARASLTVSQIKLLATTQGIGYLDYEDQEARTDLIDSMTISNAERWVGDAKFGKLNGSGIKVAVYENGPIDESLLPYEKRFTDTPSVPMNNRFHARLTNAIIKNTRPYDAPGVSHGYAPNCTRYFANSTDLDALLWAWNEGCTVVSQSFHTDDDCKKGALQSDDCLKDFIVQLHPFTFISQAAGNYWSGDPDNINPPASEWVNHKAYNCISVGNHDDTATAMDGTSVFRNPISNTGDRELPEITANGTVVDALEITGRSGTSFAAPAVAGSAALMQQLNTTLKYWPEAMRAILLASAGRRISANTWIDDIHALNDSAEGVGALNVSGAREIVFTRQVQNNSKNPTQYGWDIGNINATDSFDPKTRVAKFAYYMRKPKHPVGVLRDFRVVLAWNGTPYAKPESPTSTGDKWEYLGSKLAIDLDVVVTDLNTNTKVGVSSTYSNSFECVDFVGYDEHTYKIEIVKYGAENGKEKTWYGIAWRSHPQGDTLDF